MDRPTTAKPTGPGVTPHLVAQRGHMELTLDDLGDALGGAATVLRANAGAAGLDARVPTCPGWSVLDLVAHQGMVHRWAASHLAGAPIDDTDRLEREGRESPDVLEWFDEGATVLLQAIVDAPDDLEAFVFLRSAPAPKLFWTRRQCHETTIHAVDAMAARLGRPPRADETWIRRDVALDGIDELLVGFVPRGKRGFSPEGPAKLLVHPDASEVGWLVDLAPGRPAMTTRVPLGGDVLDSDVELTGDPVDLYLRLWSRSAAEPAHDFERWWRESVSVRW